MVAERNDLYLMKEGPHTFCPLFCETLARVFITKEKAKETFETITSSKQKYLIEAYFNCTPDGLVVVTLQGGAHEFTLINKKALSIDEQQNLLLMAETQGTSSAVIALDIEENDVLFISANKEFRDTHWDGE